MMTQLDGQAWKDLRSIISPLFTSGKLRQMSSIFENATQTLLGKFKTASDKEEAVNIVQYFRCYTMEVITAAAFGLQSRCQSDPNDAVMLAAQTAMKPSTKIWVLSLISFVIGKRLSSILMKDVMSSRFGPILKMSKAIVDERRKNPDSGNKDMLQLMLDAQHPDKPGHKLSDEEVLAQSMLFLTAGYETSSGALATVCYYLAKNPNVEEKLYQELQQIFGSEANLDTKDINESQYLEAIVHESLRLTTAAAFSGRLAKEDTVINGVTIKKNTGVMFSSYKMHRDERYWSNPNEFQPERFLPENKGDINPTAYFAFGQGPRNCIGMRFALAQIKHALARIVMSYRIETCAETSPNVEQELKSMMSNKEGAMFRVIERKE